VRLRRILPAALAAVWATSALLGAVPAGVPRIRAAEYRLVSDATYVVRSRDGEVRVTIHVTFRNTTPNPPGRFSVFEVIDLAIHDGARDVRATDHRGTLQVTTSRHDGVNVASVHPRQGVRYRDTTEFTLRYTLRDGGSRDVRIRSSVVTFPVWSFGTHGNVEVRLPSQYEALVDGDPLNARQAGDEWLLSSGAIEDPTHWLALLTATQPSTFVMRSASVPLAAGALEVQARAWSDDRAWGRRTVDLAARALPRLERQIGLDLEIGGPLVIVESLPAAGGELSEPTPAGTDVAIGFDEPPFTVLHQLAHAWFTPQLAADRWIREGFASQAAASVAGGLDATAPFDPAQEAKSLGDAAFPLVSWGAGEATARQDRYAYAASWAAAAELSAAVGREGMQRAWQRFAAGLDGYQPLDVEPLPGELAAVPVDSRHLLDQLEAVSGKDLAAIFERRVFDEATRDLMPQRAAARKDADALAERAGDWGLPAPVRLALAGWRFDDAQAAIKEAMGWLQERDILVGDIAAAGLAVPDRLRDEYRTGGGSSAARAELDAERSIVTSYTVATADLGQERSPVERAGLLGGDDPAAMLADARLAFSEGDLVAASELSNAALDRLTTAGRDGLVRLVSAFIVLIALIVIVIRLARRRRRRLAGGYTAAP
jgi:hypothetical protein